VTLSRAFDRWLDESLALWAEEFQLDVGDTK
jgi:hypothetical protein